MTTPAPQKPARKKTALRRVLMIFIPLAVFIAAFGFYLFSGRYVTTDNAYVKADKIMISPEVSGTVAQVSVGDNQQVSKGDLLFTLDAAPFTIALQRAEANLARVSSEIEEIRASYREKQEELKMAQAEAAYAVTEYKRQTALSKSQATPGYKVDESLRDRDMLAAKTQQIEQEIQVILARLEGNPDIPTQEHPLYRQAQAELEAARLDVARTEVRAPVNGMTGIMPRGGVYAPAGVPVLSLVSSDTLWIEANFKETQLTGLVEGQKVRIGIDTYPDHEWEGEVESISPATGSEFSVLPAQNATGNWVKVVQRIAVRIRPLQGDNDPPLRTGMSAEISVDTGRYPHLPSKG